MKDKLITIFKLKSFWLFVFWLLFLIWAIKIKDPNLIKLCAFWVIIAR